MKTIILILLITLYGMTASAQLVANVKFEEDIPGICDIDDVYFIIPSYEGQEEAICPVSEEEILNRLNSDVSFIKGKPKYKDKGLLELVVSCNGVIVKCELSSKTKNTDLDKQIESVFGSLGEWQAARLYGKVVDSSLLFGFKIRKGVFIFE